MPAMTAPGVLVHGGAGDLPGARIPAHVAGCERAARAGREVLRAGGTAVDAVQRAVEVLEDDPRFNAGTGACLSRAGTLELDAAIMDGATLATGGVCALPPFRHPIAIARAVMHSGRHVLYAGEGARAFAQRQGFAPADPPSMITAAARTRLSEVQAGRAESGWPGGTVGAVAWDGVHLAAATSTGGMVDKEPGRVGDSPLVGAGTFADDECGAASATGLGEAIIRVSLTRLACEFLRAGRSPQAAVEAAIEVLARRVDGRAGIIFMAPDGTPAWTRNTKTMTYAYAALDGREFSGA
jgi:beta-aspartyl-peptidase (threonine type)